MHKRSSSSMSSPQKQPTITDYFGLELMFELVSYMDMYSISAFLQAFPFLKRHTVLLTDHETEAFQFFRVDNVDVARLDQSSLQTDTLHWVFEEPRQNRVYSIQLIELTDIRLFGRLYRNLTNTNKTDNCWKPILSSNTFLFIQHGQEVSDTLFRQQSAAGRLLTLHRLCKWYVGAPLYSSVDQVWSSVEQFDQYRVKPEDDKGPDSGALPAVVQPAGLAQLQSLRIEKISEITGLYLPTVKELFIDFTDPGLSGEPLIDKVEALLVNKLVIHYRGTPPLITTGNAIGSYINSGHMDLIPKSERHAYLEITDVLALQFTTATTRTNPTPRTTAPLSERSLCPARYRWGPFKQRFDIIVLTGVPGNITTKMHLARCRSLTWTIADEFGYEDKRNRTYNGAPLDLEELTIRVCAPGMSTPIHLGSMSQPLCRVNIMLTDIDQSICPGILWPAPCPYLSKNRPEVDVQRAILMEPRAFFTHFYLAFIPFQESTAKRMIKYLSESESEGITRRLGLFTQYIAVVGFNKTSADFLEDDAEVEVISIGE